MVLGWSQSPDLGAWCLFLQACVPTQPRSRTPPPPPLNYNHRELELRAAPKELPGSPTEPGMHFPSPWNALPYPLGLANCPFSFKIQRGPDLQGRQPSLCAVCPSPGAYLYQGFSLRICNQLCRSLLATVRFLKGGIS